VDNLIGKLHLWRIDHLLLGLAIMIICYPVWQNWYICWGLQTAYWFSREVRDTEIQRGLKLPQEFYKAYNMLQWSKDCHFDFWIPTLGNLALLHGVLYAVGIYRG